MTLGTRAYIDGNGTLKAALTGSNGTADTTGVTAFDANGNALAIALDGTDAVGIAAPAGAAGIRGWLSGIYQLLTGTLTATLAAGTDVIGAVTQSGAWVLSAGSAVIGTVVPTNSAGAFSGTTVGTSATSILAANAAKVFLQIVNAGSTATLWINFGGTAAVNGSGSIPIVPGGAWTSNAAFVPSDPVSAIATASSTPITIGAK
jgi:hypothetical protein